MVKTKIYNLYQNYKNVTAKYVKKNSFKNIKNKKVDAIGRYFENVQVHN